MFAKARVSEQAGECLGFSEWLAWGDLHNAGAPALSLGLLDFENLILTLFVCACLNLVLAPLSSSTDYPVGFD